MKMLPAVATVLFMIMVVGYAEDIMPTEKPTKISVEFFIPSKNAIWTNSFGMRFVPVTGVICRFSVWETRVRDYAAFVKATRRKWLRPNYKQGPDDPAVMTSWNDANVFCAWLTAKENAAGILPYSWEYRLPTDAEWSTAAGLGKEEGRTPMEKDRKIQGVYPWGSYWPPKPGDGNFCGDEDNRPALGESAGFRDEYKETSPVGSFKANEFGLYDMGGNAWEWCEDEFSPGNEMRVLRGASWSFRSSEFLLSSYRYRTLPEEQCDDIGFRCVVAPISRSEKAR